MKRYYKDILTRIDSPPIWFDENAVPRYCAFDPSESASIYVAEVALAEITCQSCGRMFFQVAFSSLNMGSQKIAEAIRDRTLRYGDPPNVGCCSAGLAMNSVPRRVLEYWHRHHREFVKDHKILSREYHTWRRDPALEVSLEPD